jgi:TolB-like protein
MDWRRKMKIKVVLAVITAITLLGGCASSSNANGPDELDMAIREASDYLNTRVARGVKIAFVNIQSDSPALSEYIIEGLIENAVNDALNPVVDRQQLNAIRAELNFNMSGEVSDESAQAIGKMLGAQTIVTGSVAQMGDLYRIRVRALAVETAQIQGQFSRNVPANGATIAALIRSSGSSNRSGSSSSSGWEILGRRTAGSSSGGTAQTTTSAAAARLANGTYTFWPRLTATKAGLPVDNVFIPRITVAGGYMTIHFARNAQGAWTTATEWDYAPSGFYDKSHFILQDLDSPSRSYNPASAQSTNNGMGKIWSISFNQTNIRRFRLTCKMYSSDDPSYIFDEIVVPDQPDQN